MQRPPLDRAAIERTLRRDDALWTRIDVVERTESTNADAAAAGRNGAVEGLVVAAEHQVAGRGRLGRRWEAPPRSGLAVSVLLRPDAVRPARWPWLPLLAGVAVREAVADVTGIEAWLKWPNDVLVDGRKLAGILVERVETGAGAAAVVGIGLNVALTSEELPVPEATSLALSGAATLDRTALLVGLLGCLAARYRAWIATGGDPESGLRADYVAGCATIGREVRVELPDGSIDSGRAVGVDSVGRLEVESESGRRAVGAGDVVHLRSSS